MLSTDMLLTTIILIGCLPVLAESEVQCEAGDKRTTIRVESDFRQLPLERSYSNVKIITSNKAFQARSNEYARAQENYDSTDTSASVSGSYGAFSASVSAAYSAVTQSASSMSSASSSETNGETYTETENTEERKYFEGFLQILRDIKTTVIIDGISAVVEEQEIKNAVKGEELWTMADLKKHARDYISEKYGDVVARGEGEITGAGTIFQQSKCYKTPKPVWNGKGVYIPTDLSTPLYIKTDSKLGSLENVDVMFYDQENQKAGGIILRFDTQIKYSLQYCISGPTPLQVTPSTSRYKTWKITVTAGPRVVIECNGVQVLNVVLDSSTCTHSYWRSRTNTIWGRGVSSIKFNRLYDLATDAYCIGNSCA